LILALKLWPPPAYLFTTKEDDGYYTMTSGNAQIVEKTVNSILVDFEASFINTKDSSKVINLKNGVFKINNLNPATIEE
jgi:hypothetical protein